MRKLDFTRELQPDLDSSKTCIWKQKPFSWNSSCLQKILKDLTIVSARFLANLVVFICQMKREVSDEKR